MNINNRKVRFINGAGQLIFDTDYDGRWTLASQQLTAPEVKTNFVDIPGRDGAVELARGLTDGEPRYKQRTLTLRLECSDGTYAARQKKIMHIMNALTGLYCHIVLPDHSDHYLEGWCAVSIDVHDINQSAVTITATVDPYFVALQNVFYVLPAKFNQEVVFLRNRGSKRVIPILSAYRAGGGAPNIAVICSERSYGVQLVTGDAIMPSELAMDYLDELRLFYMSSNEADRLVVNYREAHL